MIVYEECVAYYYDFEDYPAGCTEVKHMHQTTVGPTVVIVSYFHEIHNDSLYRTTVRP